MSGIKAVIFDWGGVLIENPTEGILRYSREVLGIGSGCMLAAYRKLIPYFQEGKISEEEFWKGIRRRTGAKGNLPPASLWLEAFEQAYVPKEDVFAVAREIHECGCRTGILSNTEMPARPLMDREPYRIFDPLVLSWEVGSSKPQKKIFEVLIETLGLPPSDILFVDDVEANVRASRELGLRGHLFTDAQALRRALAPILGKG
ncbi:MAG: Alpha-D-glucose-1-phosphate phosphatase YihX [Syntrophaceae bacterium PtaB.Bin038]|nr:MAG: Alpha-D-glucose-1-phosphate phosphatase YihX [Syntrophaceae bacterium PtaB.Bin038]